MSTTQDRQYSEPLTLFTILKKILFLFVQAEEGIFCIRSMIQRTSQYVKKKR
jgi:hypothetical protein